MAAPRHEQLFALLMSIWAGLFTWSIIGFSLEEAIGDDAAASLDRSSLFLIWQFAAAIAAVVVYIAGRSYEKGSALRWVSRVPVALAVVALALVWIGHMAFGGGAAQG